MTTQSSRHKCAHNPGGSIQLGNDEPNSFSEYSKEYVQHPIDKRQLLKPAVKPVSEEGTIDNKTTTRQDYVKHAMEKPYARPKENYKTPDGDMDLSTNYSQQFTRKPLETTKAIRPLDERKITGTFGGEPTYAADYRTWEVARHEKAGPKNTYQPPSDLFGGSSNYKSDYPAHNVGQRRPLMKPSEQTRQTDMPFDGATEHRQSYIQHPMESGPRPDNINRPTYQPSTAPLDGMSNYRSDYPQRDSMPVKQVSCKPESTPYQAGVPFEGGTTHRADFLGYPVEKIQRHEKGPYEKPSGSMDLTTTSSMDYTKKQLEPQQPIKPSYSRHMPNGKFDATTNYKSEYQQWGPTERAHQVKRNDQFLPPEGPFESLATYRRDFIKHSGTVMTRSLKPVDPGFSSNAPLEDGTEYRKQYTTKQMDPCLAHKILNSTDPSDHGFEFHEKDEGGHVWYRPGATGTTPRG